jgi:hypothetical protein
MVLDGRPRGEMLSDFPEIDLEQEEASDKTEHMRIARSSNEDAVTGRMSRVRQDAISRDRPVSGGEAGDDMGEEIDDAVPMTLADRVRLMESSTADDFTKTRTLLQFAKDQGLEGLAARGEIARLQKEVRLGADPATTEGGVLSDRKKKREDRLERMHARKEAQEEQDDNDIAMAHLEDDVIGNDPTTTTEVEGQSRSVGDALRTHSSSSEAHDSIRLRARAEKLARSEDNTRDFNPEPVVESESLSVAEALNRPTSVRGAPLPVDAKRVSAADADLLRRRSELDLPKDADDAEVRAALQGERSPQAVAEEIVGDVRREMKQFKAEYNELGASKVMPFDQYSAAKQRVASVEHRMNVVVNEREKAASREKTRGFFSRLFSGFSSRDIRSRNAEIVGLEQQLLEEQAKLGPIEGYLEAQRSVVGGGAGQRDRGKVTRDNARDRRTRANRASNGFGGRG